MSNNGFLGRGWSFPPEFGKENQASTMVSDEEDIRQSLIILLSTRNSERFNRQYGCDLEEFVNEPINETLLSLMKNKIEKSILLYEPRITLTDIKIDSSEEGSGLLRICIYYEIHRTGKLGDLVYPFYTNNK
jgi:uncharacterized protein